MNAAFWSDRRVFVTGHTGFKGAWLVTWLAHLGARVTGYALPPETSPNLHALAENERHMRSHFGDILDRERLKSAVTAAEPEIIIHLAAQPLVRRSYREPYETFATNALGTASVLEACRHCPSLRSIVIATTDKCYENLEQRGRAYREDDRLGGHDPYSASKAAAEVIVASYRRSFFDSEASAGLASARAGNVIGGGDWSEDRLIPDYVRSLAAGAAKMTVRHPSAVRPWQHVLDCLGGYLVLAERLHQQPRDFAEAWNFGPEETEGLTVREVLSTCADVMKKPVEIAWGDDAGAHVHEATHLQLDSTKARLRLEWRPRWRPARAILETAQWYTEHSEGAPARALCLNQIKSYTEN